MTVAATAVKTAWDLVYRVSPILLTGGIASSLSSSVSTTGILGDALSSITSVGIPIAALLDPLNMLSSLNSDVDGLFAHFTPLPGGTLLDYSTAKFPFANQETAANSVIQNQLYVSVAMECAYRGQFSMLTRIATLNAMQATVSQHVSLGGRFTVVTPAMIYENALLNRITDISSDPTKPQTVFQWDFERALITTTEAAEAASTYRSKMKSGSKSSGAWVQAASGNPVASLLGGLF